jgi:flagellar hook assembly protein FlgD
MVMDPTGVPTPPDADAPDASAPVFRPLAVAPNPALDGRATFSFRIPWADARADLAVYDAVGRRVRTILAGSPGTAERAIAWDGCDDSGRAVGSGLYFARLTTDSGYGEVKRLTVVR